MARRRERRLTAAVAAALSLAAAAVVGAAAPSAFADSAPPVPTPTPAPLLPPLVPGAPGPSTMSPAPASPGFGSVTGDLVLPFFDEIRVAAVLSVEGASPPSAASLEPGGGSSSDPTPWQPKAPIQVPTAVRVPSKTTGTRAAQSKDEIIWAAYASAAEREGRCKLPVMLLAAIGEVESSSLRGRRLDTAHDAVPPVIGPALTGGSFAAIRDTDRGRWDGDSVWDHAVGPMQFIPATWRLWGADGNGDGVNDPQNIEDAALAAANYLCAGVGDLSRPADLRASILSYNHSQRYLATVLGIVEAVDSGQLAGP